MVWYSHLFPNFLQFTVNHTVKDFGIVNKAEIDVFLELSLCLVFINFISMWCVSLWVYLVRDSLCFLDLIDYFLFYVGDIFNYNLFKNFLIPFLFLFFWDPYWMSVHFIFSQRSLRLSSVLFILFTLFCSSEAISTILSSSSLICSSASDILLLIPSRVFLISVIVLFVSVCLFFNYSRSLLIDSCIFSILFSRFLIIFTLIILNFFSVVCLFPLHLFGFLCF